jgi:hypothetical protein
MSARAANMARGGFDAEEQFSGTSDHRDPEGCRSGTDVKGGVP